MATERVEKIKEALHAARQYLNGILDRVGEDQEETPVYSDGAAWNIRQLTIHLAVADKGLNRQVMSIAAGQEIVSPDFDIDRYNKRSVEKRAEMSMTDARASLEKSRTELLDWLDKLDDMTVLAKEGRHGTLEVMSVEKILYMMADHERAHAEDIAAVI